MTRSQPFGGQPQPAPTPPAPPPTARQRPAPKIWWLLGAGVVVLALVVMAAVLVVRSVSGPSDEQRATEIANRFMTAYAAGDADTLLGMLSDSKKIMHDLSLVTNEVLAASLQRAPIRQIEVRNPREGDLGSYIVPVAFTLGAQLVTMELRVVTYTRQTPTADPDLPTLDLIWLAGLEARVNGVKAATDFPTVLPGSYQITMANPHFTVENGEQTVTTVRAPAERPAIILSDKGIQTFRTTVQQSLKACLAEKTITSSCGLSVRPPTGAQPVEGTITRTMRAEDLDRVGSSLKVKAWAATPKIATSDELLGTVTTEYRCTHQGQERVCSSSKVLAPPKIDLSKPQLVVDWS